MTPFPADIEQLIINNELGAALRGEKAVFPTPSYVNAEPWPTDHSELLEKGLYPLVPKLGPRLVKDQLEQALISITFDAVGVFCAHQCFFVYIIDEDNGKSPIRIDRTTIPIELGRAFLREAKALRDLEQQGKDAPMEIPYSSTVVRMRILKRDHGIDWGIDLTNLLP